MPYTGDSKTLGPSSGHRRFCRRLTHSERTNKYCDGIAEDDCDDADECRWVDGTCTLEDTIWCRNGRIGSNSNTDQSQWDDYYMSYNDVNARGCWEHCLASPQ